MTVFEWYRKQQPEQLNADNSGNQPSKVLRKEHDIVSTDSISNAATDTVDTDHHDADNVLEHDDMDTTVLITDNNWTATN